jgi:protein tyrosine phosphatase
MLPYDKTIAVLDTSIDASSVYNYINANIMLPFDGEPNIIIATQCPKSNTFYDFAEMLYNYDIRRVIMLTGLIEAGKPKCNDYTKSNSLILNVTNPNGFQIAEFTLKGHNRKALYLEIEQQPSLGYVANE